jgi:homoserine dehydrogenase
MAVIAIMGYGVVGSGVFEALTVNQSVLEKKAGCPLLVKKVLDLRSFPGDPAAELLTTDSREILEDKSIDIVAEAMGGLSPAYAFHKQALSAGKHVVTSNKELVAEHGPELLALAKANHVNFFFEASVGGGIPIIRPLNETLSAERISKIAGILNGTTNYILSQMQAHDQSFDQALRQAQDKGYAEHDPSADVKGYDTCRKLSILLSLATGRHVRCENIATEGIDEVEKEDFFFARARGNTIKLLAKGDIYSENTEAIVAPMIVSQRSIFAAVNDVYNAVMVTGNITDNILFYGRGAGKLPAAGAMVGDIVCAAAHLREHVSHDWSPDKMPVTPFEDMIHCRQTRLAYSSPKAWRDIEKIFGDVDWIDQKDQKDQKKGFMKTDQIAFVSSPMKESEFAEKKARLEQDYPLMYKNSLRVYADR